MKSHDIRKIVLSCAFILSMTQVRAFEVKSGDVNNSPTSPAMGTEVIRKYLVENNGKPDNRFIFDAKRLISSDAEQRRWWSLGLRLNETSPSAYPVSYQEDLDVLTKCIDRFTADVPDADHLAISISFAITVDSPLWGELKKVIAPILKPMSGEAIGFPSDANKATYHFMMTSPLVQELAAKIASRLNRKVKYTHFADDGLILERHAYKSPWNELLERQDLGIAVKKIHVGVFLEP